MLKKPIVRRHSWAWATATVAILTSLLLLQSPTASLSAATPTPTANSGGGLGSSSVSPTPTNEGEISIITNTPTAQPERVVTAPKQVFSFGTKGKSPGTLEDPRSIAFDTEGNIYVGDYGSAWISKFDSKGNYIKRWQPDSRNKTPLVSLTNNAQGNIIAVRAGQIFIFDGEGKVLKKFTPSEDYYDQVVALPNGTYLATSEKAAEDDLLWLDKNGKVTRRVDKIISTMTESAQTGLQIAVDNEGIIYILSEREDSIFKFTAEGKFIERFGEKGDQPEQFQGSVNAFAVDDQGYVFVADFSGVKVFGPDTRFVMQFKPADIGVRVIRFTAPGDMFIIALESKISQYSFN